MNRRVRAFFLLSVAAFVLALVPVASGQAERSEQAGQAPLSDWAREVIVLPPGFAPGFPSGVEDLRFPPGWRDPDSENFWSYAIVLRIDEPVPSTERLEELTGVYYTGLMGAFGVGRKQGSPPNRVDVELSRAADGRHVGTMRLVDGFATFEPISVNLSIRSRSWLGLGSTLELRASPQAEGHGVWEDLQSAIDEMIGGQRIQLLAHMPRGEWRTTPTNRNQQRDVWAWGPARRSLTSVTTNSEGTGEAIFGSFRVIYEHPRRDGLSVLALSGPGLIQTGRLAAGSGRDLRFDMTLFYDQDRIGWAPEPTRTISSAWVFDTPTSYTNTWVEDQGRPVAPETTAWSYTKHAEVTPPPANAAEPPGEIRHLGAFVPFQGSAWETDAVRTVFSWIPYTEAVLMRTTEKRTGAPIAERVFYPHPHTKVIHTLGVHDSGAIDEGTAAVEGGAILIDAVRSDLDGSSRIEERIEMPSTGTMRVETWSLEGGERTRLGESTHRSAGG